MGALTALHHNKDQKRYRKKKWKAYERPTELIKNNIHEIITITFSIYTYSLYVYAELFSYIRRKQI